MQVYKLALALSFFTGGFYFYGIGNYRCNWFLVLVLYKKEIAHYGYNYKEDKNYKLGELVDFSDFSSNKNDIISWDWNLGDTTIYYTNFQNAIKKQYVSSGDKTIELKVTNSKGCFDVSSQMIKVINDCDIPNVITPNGDGINDQFQLSDQIFKQYNITVFNRWGTIILRKANQTDLVMWDGKNDNKEVCDDGVYFYILDGFLLDGTSFKKTGNISVLKN